ncbi:MAG TPA: SOS response-associated peptidase family protein [Rhizomicrobium sp.]|nr:SOS response-associated peptidase family protein [Rhizomicrobium sp.]
MCGKFEARLTWDEYCDLAGVGPGEGADALDSATVLGLFTPMIRVPVLHLGPVRKRRLTLMRWGWHNHKLADPMRGFSHLHARSEEIDRTPTWIEPFRDARGVVFAKAFNIGEVLPNGKTRQWVCSRADGAAMALAVIYSSWQLAQGRLTAFAMVTTQSCAPLDLKDDRMPAILQPDEIAIWIGEEGATPSQLKSLLRPFDGSLVVREQQAAKPKQRDRAQAELF